MGCVKFGFFLIENLDLQDIGMNFYEFAEYGWTNFTNVGTTARVIFEMRGHV